MDFVGHGAMSASRTPRQDVVLEARVSPAEQPCG